MEIAQVKELDLTDDSIQLIGIDLSYGKDFSCVSKYCTTCNTVFDIKYFEEEVDTEVVKFKECPNCKTVFKTTVELR